MNIFSVPVEVVDASVLPYLEWNDLLRFRRVCKWTKAITDGYIKVHPELAPEIEISENLEGKSLAAFMKMGIPTTRIFLNNTSGDQFYDNAGEDHTTFLVRFGPFVKSLRLDQISLIIIGKELEFLNGLKNLESLEAKCCGGDSRQGQNSSELRARLLVKMDLAANDPTLSQEVESPLQFMKGLTSLKIGNAEDLNFDGLSLYNECLLRNGKALRSIALPFSPQSTPDPTSQYSTIPHSPLGAHFAVMFAHINDSSQRNQPNFKEIDLVSHYCSVGSLLEQFSIDWNASPNFLELCTNCVSHGIKLLNVASSWFMARGTRNIPGLRGDSPDLGVPVCSLVNMDPCVFSLNMPNLKRIEIKSSSRSYLGPDWRSERPTWQSLEDLDITVDSRISNYFERNQNLFNFFFDRVSRTAMTTLRLKFEEAGTVAVPNTEHIVAACPNLKKLTLVNWPGTNKALIKLWSGLAELEEVSFESCEGLRNVVFVGEDARSPVFLKLKKLRKLSLKRLDVMPKITDTLFSLVIRHMGLTHLTLTSETPVKSITGAGVQRLLDGKFTRSIQKFPFDNWELAKVPAEEFKKLEELFRSSKML